MNAMEGGTGEVSSRIVCPGLVIHCSRDITSISNRGYLEDGQPVWQEEFRSVTYYLAIWKSKSEVLFSLDVAGLTIGSKLV